MVGWPDCRPKPARWEAPVIAILDGLAAEGFITTSLGRVARVACVTPSHQFPLGGVLPFGRRQQLLQWAQRQGAGAWVIEDDYDGEFRYGLQARQEETVIAAALEAGGCVYPLSPLCASPAPDGPGRPAGLVRNG